MTVHSNQPEITPKPFGHEPDEDIAPLKELVLTLLHKHGVTKAFIAYSAFDGGFYPEVPLTAEGQPLPTTGPVEFRLNGLPVTYSSARHVIRQLLRTALDSHWPGYSDDDGCEGHLSIEVATGKIVLHHGERYTAIQESETVL